MSWSEGYYTEVPYILSFFQEMSPWHLELCALLNGVDVPDPNGAFCYMELGCGNGVTTNMLAAAFPKATFYGVDFLPGHIVEAATLAERGGLDNIHFIEKSFAELVQVEVGGPLPKMDYIALHGVYSWVSAKHRQQIVRVINRFLKPGGLVYISYNAAPGWAPMLPIQKFLSRAAENLSGSSAEKIDQARKMLASLNQVEGGYLQSVSNSIAERMENISNGQINYLAHEYFNEHWHPQMQFEVAEELAAAKLRFSGRAEPLHAFASLIPDEHKAVLEQLRKVNLEETVRDFLNNTQFRKDTYTRGGRRLLNKQVTARLMLRRFQLVKPRDQIKNERSGKKDVMIMKPEYFEALLDLLEQGPCTIEEVQTLPLFSELDIRLVARALILLEASDLGYWLRDDDAQDERIQTFNLAACRVLDEANGKTYLVSHRFGTALPTRTIFSRHVYDGIVSGLKPDAKTLTKYCVEDLHAKVMADGQPLEDKANRKEIQKRVTTVLKEELPIWQAAGCLSTAL